MVVAASTAPLETKDKEAFPVSNNTRMHISVALAKMVDSFGWVKQRPLLLTKNNKIQLLGDKGGESDKSR